MQYSDLQGFGSRARAASPLQQERSTWEPRDWRAPVLAHRRLRASLQGNGYANFEAPRYYGTEGSSGGSTSLPVTVPCLQSRAEGGPRAQVVSSLPPTVPCMTEQAGQRNGWATSHVERLMQGPLIPSELS